MKSIAKVLSGAVNVVCLQRGTARSWWRLAYVSWQRCAHNHCSIFVGLKSDCVVLCVTSGAIQGWIRTSSGAKPLSGALYVVC
jgi:hypothetical protein